MAAGEAMRAVGRLTGVVPVVPGGIRGMAAEARMPVSVRHAAASVSSVEEGAGGELMPRVVFHGVPTLEEAREATSELIAGLEMLYPLSHDSDGHENSVNELDSSLSNSQVGPAQASLSGETTMESAAPTTVLTAFRLLRESPEVQDTVASLASDRNVLRAVRENQQFQELHNSERRRWALSHPVTDAERLGEDTLIDAGSVQRFSFEGLLNIINDMVDLVRNLTAVFWNLFGGQGGARSFANGDGAPGAIAGHVREQSLLGLAIMVIMLISLRRG